MRILAFLTLSVATWGAGPAFEVTSVKSNKLPPRERHVEFGCSPEGRFVSLGLGVRGALLWAYKLEYFQLPDAPAWIDSPNALFDIEGRAASPVSEVECRQMVQTLLAARFKLAVHWETRPIRVYALLPGRGALKMIKVTPEIKDPGAGIVINGSPASGLRTGFSMADLAPLVGRWTSSDAPVVDRTGLEGFYKISVEVTVSRTPGETTDIATVAQQLGLRVEDRKEPFQVLVIDHLEPPDAN
jgi:uncharacterized protein (TIGR03435 family)